MPTKLDIHISYLTAKRKYEKLLRERMLLAEQRWEPSSSGANAAFVKPFTDVFKALKLTAQDIGNSARLMLGALLTFDPEKLEKKIDAFEQRRGILRAAWDPIIKDSLDAIKTADPLLSLALMPQVYLGSLGLAAGIATGKTAAEVISGESWKRLIEKLERMPTERFALNAILNNQEKEAKGKKKGVLGRLSKLFFGESLIREQEEEKSKDSATEYDTSSEESWLKDFIDDTGLDNVFNDLATQAAESQTDVMKDVSSMASRARTGALLVAADSPERFESTLSQAVSSGLLEADNVKELQGVMGKITEQAEVLAKSKDFRSTLAAEKQVSTEDLSDEDVSLAAKKSAFNAGKLDFNQQIMNGDGDTPPLSSILESIEKMKEEVMPNDDMVAEMKKRTDLPAVKEMLQVYETTKQDYDKARKAFDAVKNASSATE